MNTAPRTCGRYASRVCGAALMALVPTVLAAQDPPLADLELEQLMLINVQQVFGASERLQPVTEAPSSVTIVTAEDITRFGYRTLADILRGVRGFYITNDRSYDHIGVRGFNRLGDFSTRVLLLVDGHRYNDIVYDQANVGGELRIDTALFERVEIIRGPASSLYGASAFFAVVNIITRTGAAIDGVSINAEAGTLGTERVQAAVGKRLPNGVDFALSATRSRSDGVKRLYFPAFDSPATSYGIAEDLDGEQVGQMFGRIGFKDLNVTGSFGVRTKLLPTAAYSSLFNEHDPLAQETDRYGAFNGQYKHAFGRNHVNVDMSFDWAQYWTQSAFENDNPAVPLLINTFSSLGTRWGASAYLTRPLIGRQTVTVGVDLVDNINQDILIRYNDPLVPGATSEGSSNQFAAYAVDEIKVRRWLILNAGLRYDRYARFNKATPRGALIVLPSANQSLKYLYGLAFRAPNTFEQLDTSPATVNLRPESIETHEVVWEQYVGRWLRTSVSAYRYVASRLISPEGVNSDGTATYANGDTMRATGVEFEGEIRSKRGFQAVTSYARQRAKDDGTGAAISNSPEHMAKLRVSVPGPAARSFLSLEWQYLSRRNTLAGSSVAPASLANITMNFPLWRSLMMTGIVRNLFDQRYADPASNEYAFDTIQQNGRTLRIGVQWTFWKS